jgi:hypothetical protein
MALHGCHNLPREGKPLLVQDGWVLDPGHYSFRERQYVSVRHPRMVKIPFVNSLDCRHDKRMTDPGCESCIHAKSVTE